MSLEDDRGDFGGTAQVTYTGGDPEGGKGVFGLRVSVGGKAVATLVGGARRVMPGRAATLRLVSEDKFVKGPYKYEFRNG